ncbi:MAG TPA: EVE domain-containing protein [Phycisphaerae bacterium]|nr:EVE domain-containing protein [Phycisphaerae bacterium]
MACWLLKTEPSDYSFADLQRDGQTAWEGVTNALAVKHLQAMKKSDDVLLYHTGKEKAVVGLAKVVKAERGLVTIKAGLPLRRAVTLAEIKAQKNLADWTLVRMGRLSVVPVTNAQWDAVLAMGRQTTPTA